MSDGMRDRLLALLAANDREPRSLLRRICGLCISELFVSGAGVSVMSGTRADGHRGLVHGTSPVSARLEDLQLTVGEGPCLDAYESGGPVLIPDLIAEQARWPGFTPGALAAGVAAVFSFPLQIGAIRLGVLDLHRGVTGSLRQPELVDALLLADAATQTVLDDLDGSHPAYMPWLADIHPEVHQASGILTVRLGVSMQEALLRIRAHAYAHQLSLAEVGQQIVDHRLLLEMEYE